MGNIAVISTFLKGGAIGVWATNQSWKRLKRLDQKALKSKTKGDGRKEGGNKGA